MVHRVQVIDARTTKDETMKLATWAWGAAWLACSSAALAQTTTSPSGRLLASGCFQSHGGGSIVQRAGLASATGGQPDAQPTTNSAGATGTASRWSSGSAAR